MRKGVLKPVLKKFDKDRQRIKLNFLRKGNNIDMPCRHSHENDKERDSEMKRMIGTMFLIVMLTVSALAGVAYLAAQSYIDPTLNDLNKAVATIPPEAQEEVMPHLAELQRLRETGNHYIPSVLLLAGLTATLIFSLLFRRFVKDSMLISEKGPKRMEAEISTEQEKPRETVAVDLLDVGACRILSILQNKGRIIDFFQENITTYPDAQIGAAVRHIHQDCRKALHEHITLAPVMAEKEGETVRVSKGFDPSEIRLTGDISGQPPFEGVLQHSGWKVTRIDLPEQPKGQNHTVIAPAEVEMGQIDQE